MPLIQPELKKRIDLIGNVLMGTSLVSSLSYLWFILYYPVEIFISITAFFVLVPLGIFVVFCFKIPDFLLPEKYRGE